MGAPVAACPITFFTLFQRDYLRATLSVLVPSAVCTFTT